MPKLKVHLALELGLDMGKDLESDESLAPPKDGRFIQFKERGCVPDRQLDLEIGTISYKDLEKVSE